MAANHSMDTASWEERYQTHSAPLEPSDLLLEFSDVLPARGRALDLACGGGRNSVHLAQRGLRVTAVDRSREALRQGRELARRMKVHVNWVEADLKEFELPPCAYDLVIVFYYRDPSLYPRLSETLRAGGLLVYETYTAEQVQFRSGPRNPAHLLGPAELLREFCHLKVIFYRETTTEHAVASFVAGKSRERA